MKQEREENGSIKFIFYSFQIDDENHHNEKFDYISKLALDILMFIHSFFGFCFNYEKFFRSQKKPKFQSFVLKFSSLFSLSVCLQNSLNFHSNSFLENDDNQATRKQKKITIDIEMISVCLFVCVWFYGIIICVMREFYFIFQF